MNRIIALHERVKELVQPDWFALVVPLAEVIPGKELLNSEMTGQPDDTAKVQLPQPLVIVVDDRLLPVQHSLRLLRESTRILHCLFQALLRPGAFLVTWVANRARKGADEKYHRVAQFLKLPQLSQGNGMAQVEVAGCGIEAAIDAQRAAVFSALFNSQTQFRLHIGSGPVVAKLDAPHQNSHLLIYRRKFRHLPNPPICG